MNVLLIDDDEMTRTLLRILLTRDGYTVVGEANNGKSGVEKALKLKPTIIFLDIMMPDSSGIDVMKMILQHLPKTLILMVTGKQDAQTVKTCLELGAKGYIIKPFNAKTVMNVITNAVSRAGIDPKKP